MLRLLLLLAPLTLAAPSPPAVSTPSPPAVSTPTAKALSPKELFDSRAAAWKGVRTQKLAEMRSLVKAFESQPHIAQGLQQDWRRHLEWQAMQMGLARKLMENQAEAVKDGLIDEARRDLHNAKLDRMVAERLFFLWGNTVATEWNGRLEGAAKVLKVPGYPFAVSPSQEEFDAHSSKDFLPVYDKEEKRMKTISLDEAAK